MTPRERDGVSPTSLLARQTESHPNPWARIGHAGDGSQDQLQALRCTGRNRRRLGDYVGLVMDGWLEVPSALYAVGGGQSQKSSEEEREQARRAWLQCDGGTNCMFFLPAGTICGHSGVRAQGLGWRVKESCCGTAATDVPDQ